MNEGRWITINGKHIFLKEGQSPMDAFIRSKGKSNAHFEYAIKDVTKDDDIYNEMSDESYNKLEKNERREIRALYIGTEHSYDFNEALREDKKETRFLMEDDFESLKKSLDKACETYTAKQDLKSTRFVDLNYLRNAYGLDIPEYGDIDRNKVADSMKEFIGSELSSKSYTSVSLNESGNGMFNNLAVKMEIDMPKGTKMYVSDNLSEYEAILGRNKLMTLKDVKFKPSNVKGMENEYGKILLTYEVIEDEKQK